MRTHPAGSHQENIGMNIAITGSSGTIGGRVARELSRQGFPLTLLLRSPDKAPALPHTTVRACHYADYDASRQALTGIDLLFMVSASESATRGEEHRSFVRAARDAGVGHIVYLSFANARPDSTFTLARTHADTEQAIRDSGMAYTFLRDNFYTEIMLELADAHGVIRGPAGNGRVACVSQRDVADAAVRVLMDLAQSNHRPVAAHRGQAAAGNHAADDDATDSGTPRDDDAVAVGTSGAPARARHGSPASAAHASNQPGKPHLNRTYTLTGPQSLNMAEVATELTRATGKPHRFHHESIDEAYASRRAGWPAAQDWELDAWVSTYTAIAQGELAEMTDDLPRLLERPPLTLPLTLALAQKP
ncbi:MAG: NAD(P)H-binding protein [Lautropia sp.]|nr:NAD(P)H-binding protein [Lautropia sp.]